MGPCRSWVSLSASPSGPRRPSMELKPLRAWPRSDRGPAGTKLRPGLYAEKHRVATRPPGGRQGKALQACAEGPVSLSIMHGNLNLACSGWVTSLVQWSLWRLSPLQMHIMLTEVFAGRCSASRG